MSVPKTSFSEFFKSKPEVLSDIVGVLLIGLDIEGNIRFVNRKTCEILEYKRDELLKMNWFKDVIPSELKKDKFKTFTQILSEEKGTGDEFESIIITKTGKERAIKSVGKLLKDDDGDVVGVLNSGEDVTIYNIIKEELRKNEERFRGLFNRVPIGLYRTNPKGEIIEANPSLVNMLRYPNREVLVNTNINDIFVDKKVRAEELNTLKNNDILNHEIDLYRYDGSIIHVNDTARSIKDNTGKVNYYEGSLEDITEKMIAEEALKKSEKKLRKINAEKDKFFSIVAHDLKSAFNSMLGFSDLLIKNFDDYDRPKKKKFIDIIQQNILNAYKLLENLLVWSRAQRGVIEYKPEDHNLYLIIDETIELIQQAADNKSIQIENKVSEHIFIYADKNMVLTILRNLINNAVKFTPSNGKVTIEAKLGMKKDDKRIVDVSVSDTGIGIKKDSLKKLFKLSESLSTKGTDNEPGTGLGLILCKDFIEKHGGKMTVSSEEGKGSTFKFSIPLGQI